MKTNEIRIIVYEYESFDELPSEDQKLILMARRASEGAYSPYSGFRVGAAVRMDNDVVVTGNNQENSAYPSGLCAERVALFYAHANYQEAKIKSLAISAAKNGELVNEPVKPCGACSQVLLELENRSGEPIRIILDGGKRIEVLVGVNTLLPLSFNKDSLK